MSTKFKSYALAVAAFAMMAATASAQVTTVEGVVKDEKGAVVQGAIIHLTRTDIKGNYTTKTDKKGHYGHYGLPIGTYDITLEVNGKVVDSVKAVRTTLSGIPPLNFDIKPPQQAATAAGGQPTAPPPEVIQKMSKEDRAKYEKANKDKEAQIAKNKALNDTYNAGRDALNFVDPATNKPAPKYDVAVENLKKASDMDPSQNVIWSQLAEAYMGLGSTKTGDEQTAAYQSGLDAYKKAIEQKPEDAALENNYGLALVKAKKPAEAQEALNKAAEIDPSNAVRYYYNLGAVLVNANQADAAATAFKKAIASFDAIKAAGTPPPDIVRNYADANYQYGIVLLGKANTDATTGKVTPVPGTIEAFNAYLQFAPDGQFADSAKGMISTIGGTVATTYQNPDGEKNSKKKVKK
jgi:tetratricopeptide (TPR) repeat protein